MPASRGSVASYIADTGAGTGIVLITLQRLLNHHYNANTAKITFLVNNFFNGKEKYERFKIEN
jgi:hypothetical protein